MKPRTVWTRILPIWTLFLLAVGTRPSDAHNGALAVAAPLTGIVVDGDLSDWPAEMPRYPLALTEYGIPPQDEEDFRGWFRVGYDPEVKALYLAVEVRDQSTVVDRENPSFWDTQDGCEIYLDPEHHERRSAAVQHTVRGAGTPALDSGEKAFVSLQRTGDWHTYEWRLKLDDMKRPPTTLGLDLAVCDKDEDGSFSWMTWGKRIVKVGTPNRRGDVVLTAGRTGEIRGRVKWRDTGEGLNASGVRIASPDHPDLWVRVETGLDGTYRAELPAGRYRVASELDRMPGGDREVVVTSGEVTDASFSVSPGKGETVPAGSGRSLNAERETGRGAWHRISSAENPGGGVVSALLEDRAGYLWIGTESGLSRFDGESFTAFGERDGLRGTQIRALVEEDAGALWIGTESGLNRFDGTRFTNFTTRDGLVDDAVLSLLEDRAGYLWIGTESGLSRFDGTRFTNFTAGSRGLASNRIISLLEDGEGTLWVGTQGGLHRYEDGKFIPLELPLDLRDENNPSDNVAVLSLLKDRAGRIWVGTWGATTADSTEIRRAQSRLYRIDRGRLRRITPADPRMGILLSRSVLALFEDRDGGLWIGTDEALLHYDGRRFVQMSGPDYLNLLKVTALLEDREGNLWLGTNDGVMRRDAGLFTRLTVADGLAGDFITSLLEDREKRVWIGTQQGLSLYDGRTVRNFSVADGLGDDNVQALLEDRHGRLWVGTLGGVSRFDGKRFVNYTTADGLIGNRVFALAEDGEGHLWASTAQGLSRFDGERFVNYTVADGLPYNALNTLAVDGNGGLWIGTVQAGVSRFDGERFVNYTAADGLGDDRIEALTAAPDGTVWVGTAAGGISRFDGQRFRTYTVDDGLASNRIFDLSVDDQGILWIGTVRGISRFDGSVFQNLLRKDGLESSDVTAILQDRDGVIWFGFGARGIIRYRTGASRPLLYLTDAVTDRRHGPVERIRMTTAQPRLVFDYRGISFKTRPEAMVYRYRLRGYEQEWKNTHARRVEYRDLPRGNYLFEMEALDRDLSHSAEMIQVAVKVTPPYGQIGLQVALALAILLISFQAWQIIRRNRNLQRAYETLDRAHRELQEMQQKLVESERLNTLMETAGAAAHEINQPLQGIFAMGEMLLMIRERDEEEREQKVKDILEQAARINAIVAKMQNIQKYATTPYPGGRKIIDLDAASHGEEED